LKVGTPTVALVGLLHCLALRAQEGAFVADAAAGIAFLYDSGADACAAADPVKPVLPLGTGFFVGVPLRQGAQPTAKGMLPVLRILFTTDHVIGDRSSVVLRVNRTDRSEFTCFPVSLRRQGAERNTFLPDRREVDLIAIIIPDIPGADPMLLSPSLLLSEKRLREFEVREGTEVFVVGYLFGYSGLRRNLPVAKFGRVALMSNEAWYMSSRGRLEKAFLVELHNAPGLSGAPVMLNSPQIRVDAKGGFGFRRMTPFVLGVVKGLLKSPIGGTQGVAAIEPAAHLAELLRVVTAYAASQGLDLDTSDIPATKE